jgi:hypothetical protein
VVEGTRPTYPWTLVTGSDMDTLCSRTTAGNLGMEDMNRQTSQTLFRLVKLVWVLLCGVALAMHYFNTRTATAAYTMESFVGLYYFLLVMGFPTLVILAVVAAAAAPALGEYSASAAFLYGVPCGMVLLGYIQWFVIVPRIVRSFREGKELKW